MASVANRRYRGRLVEALIGTVLLAAVYFVWMGDDLYRQDMVTFGCVYALVALGMYIPLVMSGSLSVAYNSYFAVGAYAVGLLAVHTTLSLFAALPAAIVIAALVAIGIALVSRGLTGYHLAVATLAVAQASDRFLIHAEGLTGGATGIGGFARPTLFGLQLDRSDLLLIGLILVALGAVTINRLRDSLWGLSLRLQKESPLAAEACGVPTELNRIVSLCIGAALATVGGVFFAIINQLIIPESFTLAVVFTVIFIPILGGSRSAWGCVLGAAIVVFVNEMGSQLNISGSLVFGVAVMAVLLIAPGGLLGILYALAQRAGRERVGPEANREARLARQ